MSKALIDDLFRTSNTGPVDVEFEYASNASELSCMLCHVMTLGYEILHDVESVFRRMQRLGVTVRCDLLQDVQQLVADSNDPEDLRNHKFLVVMSDGSKYILSFAVRQHTSSTCHGALGALALPR